MPATANDTQDKVRRLQNTLYLRGRLAKQGRVLLRRVAFWPRSRAWGTTRPCVLGTTLSRREPSARWRGWWRLVRR